jgi:hypothetical protein
MKDPGVKLRRKFYRELPEYVRLLGEQGGVCKICKRPPAKIRLSVDHDHAVDRVKVSVWRFGDGWLGSATYKGTTYDSYASSRKNVWELVKKQLFRRAIRGLLCFRCNGGIQHFEDSKAPLKPAERFDAAAKYFRDFEGGFNGPTG